jgi:hypothetical protein
LGRVTQAYDEAQKQMALSGGDGEHLNEALATIMDPKSSLMQICAQVVGVKYATRLATMAAVLRHQIVTLGLKTARDTHYAGIALAQGSVSYGNSMYQAIHETLSNVIAFYMTDRTEYRRNVTFEVCAVSKFRITVAANRKDNMYVAVRACTLWPIRLLTVDGEDVPNKTIGKAYLDRWFRFGMFPDMDNTTKDVVAYVYRFDQ